MTPADPNPGGSRPNTPRKIPSPKGTRDLYPEDLLRQRYITEAWRRVSIRHGFEEIAGPTFEMLDLYTVKSGEGIVSELFSFRRQGGEDDYALRPEFTPTLARMFAAKAASLPSPTKWFTAGPYFRAERPQRGRLREFVQWNCDVLGGEDSAGADFECISVLIDLARESGLTARDVAVYQSDRHAVRIILEWAGVAPALFDDAVQLLDRRNKLSPDQFAERAKHLGLRPTFATDFDNGAGSFARLVQPDAPSDRLQQYLVALRNHLALIERFIDHGEQDNWIRQDYSIVRGLAYYTGTVFELVADGERAVAGGGRYDNLIELFGGPSTPAVGFGMGDVVLGLLLDDKRLMPEGGELREALSRPPASLRPEAFVIADAEMAGLVEPLLAVLRRGVEREGHDAGRPWARDRYAVAPLHARRSYRAKRKKQVEDASSQLARFVVTVNEPGKVELRDMDARQDLTPRDVPGMPGDAADFSVEPGSAVYVGRAIAALCAPR
jgi:histidyl-tRNA synthetase